MRWLYPANVRIPSEKAHVYQIFQMVDALQHTGVDIELTYPARANIRGMQRVDPVAFYGLRSAPHLRALPALDPIRLVTIDVPALNRRPFPQIAFAMQSASFAMAAALWVRRLRGLPSVVYGRDWPILAACALAAPRMPLFWEAHDLPQSRLAAEALSRLLPRLTGVIAITDGLRDALVRRGVPWSRILVAADAVDLRRFAAAPERGAARQRLGLPPDAPLVVYTGHLYRWKGAHTLALASRYLPPEVIVAIVGGTPADLVSFRAFLDLERLERVHVAGYVPPAEVPVWLAAADGLALPNSAGEAISAQYTSPLKLFEYMAARRPMVASDLPSLREVLRHDENALLVPPDDPQALAAGLQTLLDDPARAARLANAAWEDVQGRTWDARAAAAAAFVKTRLRKRDD
jgi:glycosyltransferase involved in cell wall biosynthesis